MESSCHQRPRPPGLFVPWLRVGSSARERAHVAAGGVRLLVGLGYVLGVARCPWVDRHTRDGTAREPGSVSQSGEACPGGLVGLARPGHGRFARTGGIVVMAGEAAVGRRDL